MKVVLNQKLENLFVLMDESKILPLKKFVCDIKSFNAVNKIKSKSSCAYPGKRNTYEFKDFNCTCMSTVRVKEDQDAYIVAYVDSVNNKRIGSSTLTISGNSCELVVASGKQKETYSFKFNSKRVYQFVDKNQKEIER